MKNPFLLLLFTFFTVTGYSQSKIITLEVAPYKVDCQGMIPTKCLQVKDSSSNEWKNFMDPIEGFDFEEGYEYVIVVERKDRVPQAPDLSPYTYSLKEMKSKTPVDVSSSLTLNFLDGKKMTLISIRIDNRLQRVAAGRAYIIFNTKRKSITGNDGCNSISVPVTIGESKISFGELTSTRMLCPDVTIDKPMHEWLSQATRYRIHGNQLFIYKDNAREMVFEEMQ